MPFSSAATPIPARHLPCLSHPCLFSAHLLPANQVHRHSMLRFSNAPLRHAVPLISHALQRCSFSKLCYTYPRQSSSIHIPCPSLLCCAFCSSALLFNTLPQLIFAVPSFAAAIHCLSLPRLFVAPPVPGPSLLRCSVPFLCLSMPCVTLAHRFVPRPRISAAFPLLAIPFRFRAGRIDSLPCLRNSSATPLLSVQIHRHSPLRFSNAFCSVATRSQRCNAIPSIAGPFPLNAFQVLCCSRLI